jgi:hypothetical protein
MDLILVIFGFLILILLNLLITRLIIGKALKKLVVPRLVESGFDFIRIEKVGFLKTGDFNDSSFSIRPYNRTGNYKISLYRYVVYKDRSKKERKTTLRIDWNIFRKTKIDFKPGLK